MDKTYFRLGAYWKDKVLRGVIIMATLLESVFVMITLDCWRGYTPFFSGGDGFVGIVCYVVFLFPGSLVVFLVLPILRPLLSPIVRNISGSILEITLIMFTAIINVIIVAAIFAFIKWAHKKLKSALRNKAIVHQ